MSMEFRLPNFQVETASEQRLYTYLYQTVQQLNWAMKQLSPRTEENEGVMVTRPGNTAGEAPGAAAVFQNIKGLIIKSADIVNAYYDTISLRLQGQYVAQSDFGAYREETSQTIAANSRETEQRFQNLQVIWQDVDGELDTMEDRVEGAEVTLGSLRQQMEGVQTGQEGLNQTVSGLQTSVTRLQSSLLETNAYIRTGILYYQADGTPVYGLEIGQTNEVGGVETFRKFARFSSSRLSFYDGNDTEVAYISDYKLYITNVHITGNLTIGQFEIDTSDGLAFRWMGGDG